MPIQHVVLITFNRQLSHDEANHLLQAAKVMKNVIPEIIDLRCGVDIGLSGVPGMMFSLTATFKDTESYLTYQNHDCHKEFIERHIKPVLADRKAVQFEICD